MGPCEGWNPIWGTLKGYQNIGSVCIFCGHPGCFAGNSLSLFSAARSKHLKKKQEVVKKRRPLGSWALQAGEASICMQCLTRTFCHIIPWQRTPVARLRKDVSALTSSSSEEVSSANMEPQGADLVSLPSREVTSPHLLIPAHPATKLGALQGQDLYLLE